REGRDVHPRKDDPDVQDVVRKRGVRGHHADESGSPPCEDLDLRGRRPAAPREYIDFAHTPLPCHRVARESRVLSSSFCPPLQRLCLSIRWSAHPCWNRLIESHGLPPHKPGREPYPYRGTDLWKDACFPPCNHGRSNHVRDLRR